MPVAAGAFKQENETKISSEVASFFGPSDYTITTKILSARGLVPARVVMGVSNPFVDIQITPPDARFGEQLQRSSYKALTLTPSWTPYERFQHTTNNIEGKILFSMYHLRTTNLRSPSSLGEAVIKFSEITEEPTTKTLRLFDRKSGKQLDGEKTLAKKALLHEEQVVYEYERWQPVVGWGNKSMLPTDPGCYSNEYGTKFASTFNEVAPPIPRGWVILTEFHALGNTWEYAVDLTRSDWYAEKSANCFVRRKPWFREVVHPNFNKPPPPPPVAPVAPPPPVATPPPVTTPPPVATPPVETKSVALPSKVQDEERPLLVNKSDPIPPTSKTIPTETSKPAEPKTESSSNPLLSEQKTKSSTLEVGSRESKESVTTAPPTSATGCCIVM